MSPEAILEAKTSLTNQFIEVKKELDNLINEQALCKKITSDKILFCTTNAEYKNEQLGKFCV